MSTQRSYFRRIAVWFLLLAGVPSLLLPALLIFNKFQSGERHLRELARQIQANLAQNSKQGLLTGEVEHELAPIAEAVCANPDVAAVVFRDQNQRLLYAAVAGDKAIRPAIEQFVPQGSKQEEGRLKAGGQRLLYVTGPVTTWRMADAEQLFGFEKERKQQLLGSVTLFVTTSELLSSIRTRTLQSLFVVFFTMAMAGVVAFRLARRVTRPVYDLVAGFQEVSNGNFDPQIPEPREPILKILVGQFRESVRHIKDLMKEKDVYSQQLLSTATELEELNETLEEKIASRTQSLENAVQMLELSNRKIQEADRLKSEFLANMSHELRTPLNAVIGFSELLLERIPGPVTTQQEECLQDILHSGQHLLQLINEILDLSKVEAGKMPVVFTTLSFGAILASIQALFKPLFAKKKQTLAVDCPEPETLIYTDQNKLKQILINLLSNAHKFSPEGAEVQLSVRKEEECHAIVVKDRGVGIPREHLGDIFEAFRQLDGSPSRNQEGTGLGLTLCKRFTELLGGELTVESEVGHGSTFTLVLPLDPSRKPAAKPPAEQADGESAAG